MTQAKSTPKAIVATLVRAWDAPLAGAGPRATLAPSILIQELLAEHGYDEALHRARGASKVDPFALHLGLERLARDFLLGSARGRPKLLASVLLEQLPSPNKLTREISSVLGAVKRGAPASFPGIVRDMGTPGFARAFYRASVADPLEGSSSARLATAERVVTLACQAMTIWYYPFLSRPELTEALHRAATEEKSGSPLQDKLVGALRSLDRYIVDARTRPLMLACLSSPSAEGRRTAASALLAFARTTAWPKEKWSPVIALLDDESPIVREGVSSALLASRERLASEERRAVATKLERHLEDRVLGVRIAAVSGLARLRGRAFLKEVRALEKREKNKTMRLVLKRTARDLSEG